MDASTAHHVGRGVQQVGDPRLKGDQFNKAEMGIIEIEKKIDIAVGAGVLTCSRSK